MRLETYIRKALGLKAHRVVRVDHDETAREVVVHIDRLDHRRLRCGEGGLLAERVAARRRPGRRWRDLALREEIVYLAYAPCRVWCSRCGLRVERLPWAAIVFDRFHLSQWSALLKRVFALAVLVCPRCGGRRHIGAVVTAGQRLRALLERLGLGDPAAAPSRSPPQSDRTL